MREARLILDTGPWKISDVGKDSHGSRPFRGRRHAELVLDRLGTDDPLRGELTPIRDAGERAALLTRQLLLFSRKAMLTPRVVDCADLVQRTSQMLRRLIIEAIEISVVSPPVPMYVKADPTQIEQVIMNLSLNASDAMPDGGRLSIETRFRECDATFCREHPECPRRVVTCRSSVTRGADCPRT